MSKIEIFALGGLQENGKNLYCVEVDSKIFILDAGIKFPTSELYGIDRIVPDISYLEENKHNIKGLFLTNGHVEHIGAAGMLLQKLGCKIYGSEFTIALVKDGLECDGVEYSEENFIVVNDRTRLIFEDINVRFFIVAHNIPGCYGVCINTKDGNIIYTSDFSFDQNARINYQKMYSNLTLFSKEEVLALMCESLGALNEDSRGTILEFKKRIEQIFISSDNRIIFSLFSGDLQRIQQIINIAISFNKRVAIIGRKTQRIVDKAISLGYLKIPKESLVSLKFVDENHKNNDKDLVVIITGERHEPYHMLQRMSKGIDRLVKMEKNDTVVVLTVPYIGTEKMAARTLDMIYKVTTKVKVFNSNLLPSPYATREEIKGMINILKPKYILPVIGEYRHQYAFISAAQCVEVNKENIIILDNGDKACLIDSEYKGIHGDVPFGEINIDGRQVGDLGDVVMRDRELLAEDGVIMVIANVNPRTKKVVAGPELVCKGFNFNAPDTDLMELFNVTFAKVSTKYLLSKFIEWADYKNDLKNEVSRLVYKYTRRSPIIIPVLISTDVENIKQKKAEKKIISLPDASEKK